MTLLWAFPWPTVAVSRVEATDYLFPLLLFGVSLLAFLAWFTLLGGTMWLRTRLRRQVASIPVVTWSPLHQQVPCDGANGVTRVDVRNLRMAGFVSASAQNIDIGESETALWRAFKQFADGAVLPATGAAADGIVAWAWTCWAQQRSPIAWVQRSTNGQPHERQQSRVCLLGANAVTFLDVSLVDELQHVQQLVKWAGVNVIFLDGVPHKRQELADTMFQFTSHAYLHHQAPCDGANGVTHVDVGNLRMAGLVSASAPHSQPIFLRQEAIDQFVWLRAFIAGNHHVDTDGGREVARVAHIEGPPGTGKSTITWAWACELARQQPVLWAHHSSNLRESTTVTLLAGGRLASFKWRGENFDSIFFLAAWASVRVIVVDGVKREHAQLAADAREWTTVDPQLRRKVVTVSSAQLRFKSDTERTHAMIRRPVFSWAKVDYVSACADEAFWDHVKGTLGWAPSAELPRTAAEEEAIKGDLIRSRFFLAGASARWMFALSRDQLLEKIADCVDAVSDAAAAAGSEQGERSRDAVNSLYARFPSAIPHTPAVRCLVSGKVTRLLGDRCDLNFITTATRHNLPAGTDGTVFELDFRHHIKQAAQRGHGNNFVTVYVHDGPQCRGLRLPVTRVFEFNAVADLAVLDIVDGAWFLPLDDCNGGYDFAFYDNGCLFSLQITKELPSHSEKWRYMNELAEVVHGRLTALARPAGQPGLQFVEHIYVVPVPNVDGFQAPAGGRVEGNPHWLDTHRRVVSFQRAGGAGPMNVVGIADIEPASRQAQGRNGGLVPLQIVRGRQLNRAASARSVGNVPW